MAGNFKKLLCKRVLEYLSKIGWNSPLSEEILTSYIQIGPHRNNSTVELQVPLYRIKSNSVKINQSHLDHFPTDTLFYSASINTQVKVPYLAFNIDAKDFITNTITLQKQINPPKIKSNTKTIVEFSSPNIAKPFHMGHLRSTIIGNFISNLKEYLGEDVIKLNYLGDWGTQFGYLKLGIDMANVSEEDMRTNPIKHLYEAYVNANKLAETDPTISVKARDVFAKLEKGDLDDIEKWKSFRDYTVNELIKVYERLGVNFSKYDWESMYSTKNIEDVIRLLENKDILKTLPDGKRVVEIADRKVTVMKSDGTSLYLSRDISAALDRHKRYKFDNMYYVVDNAQTDHFNALFGVFKQMELPWSERCKHIKFGRIRGMSTRKGEVVFLNDILDEARDIMHKRQLDSPTTKISNSDSTTADILGVSAVIVNDLKQRRTRDYQFDWNNALHMQGDSGIKLQHTHCRLSNLEKNSGASFPEKCDAELLLEPEAVQLINEIARFDEILIRADQELEAYILVNYLFGLCNSVNKAMKILRVKDQGAVGDQRLLMFHCAKQVLHQGMKILGLKPLNEM